MMKMMISLLAARRGWGCTAAFQSFTNNAVTRSFSFNGRHHPSRCIAHYVSTSATISCDDTETSLVSTLKEAYLDKETDGIIDIIRSNKILEQMSKNGDVDACADKLVTAAIEASNSNKSLAAILNSILASCCGDNETEDLPEVALAVLELMDEMHDEDESTMIKPDIVTLSLVYYILCNNSQDGLAQSILERAQQMSKKLAGSQRRRALAAERRKKSNVLDAKEVEEQLQSIYGPDFHILHDSDDLIVLSKPAGQVCYHTKKTSAGKISQSRKKKKKKGTTTTDDDGSKIDISLEDSLIDMNVALSTVNHVARGIVHRLDRGTSGCICLAKSDEAHMKLIATFFLRRVTKKYLAMVPSPSSPLDPEGEIGTLVDGKPARSLYKVVKSYHEDESRGVTLLEVETFTGRKHQVRKHCSDMGLPIIFDPIYSSFEPPVPASRRKTKKDIQRKKSANNEITEKSSLPSIFSDLEAAMVPGQEQFFLHAKSLAIPEFDVDVEAPIPTWWTETIDHL